VDVVIAQNDLAVPVSLTLKLPGDEYELACGRSGNPESLKASV